MVHVIFGVEGTSKLNTAGTSFDVEATGGHVGAHQQIDLTLLEGIQRLQPLVLALVAMQRGGLQAFALQAAARRPQLSCCSQR